MEDNRTLLFSAMELNVCAQLLGHPEWNDIPVKRSELSLEQRMLEAFLCLTEMGLIVRRAQSYVCAPEMEQRMACVLEPERMVLREAEGAALMWLYEKGGRITSVEELTPGTDRYRVSDVPWEERGTWLLRGLGDRSGARGEVLFQVWKNGEIARVRLRCRDGAWMVSAPEAGTNGTEEETLKRAVWGGAEE